MAESDGKQSFWTTIPGILTGIAAILTALTGLYLALHPSQKSPDAAAPPPAKPAISSSSTPAQTVASPPSSQPSSSAGSVSVTSRAGDTTQLSLKSFQHNFTGTSVTLMSGQSIAFEKIRSIDFGTWNDTADTVAVTLTLTDGRQVTGDVDSRYAYTGESDLGHFNIFVQDLRRIAFQRP